jgi:hypothetical protein
MAVNRNLVLLIIAVLTGAKPLLAALGWHVFDDNETEAIANGVGALVALVSALLTNVKAIKNTPTS